MRAVLLDGLGTLVSLAPPGPLLSEHLWATHGLRIGPGEAQRAFRAEIAYYRAHHCEGRDADALADLRRRCAEVLHEALPASARGLSVAELTHGLLASLRFSAYPETAATLRALRSRGLALVVVSNWDISLAAVLRSCGLAEELDGVVTSAAVGSPKPALEIFSAGLALADVSATEAVHVGDSLTYDVEGARAAGITPVLVRRGSEAMTATVPPTATIASLAELPALLEQRLDESLARDDNRDLS